MASQTFAGTDARAPAVHPGESSGTPLQNSNVEISARTREGAAAFIGLMMTVQTLSEADLERYSEVAETGRDVRDYQTMACAVAHALRYNLFEADREHAQGFLRALTDLLCMEGDGCGPGDDWDPIRNTAAAYGEKQEVAHD